MTDRSKQPWRVIYEDAEGQRFIAYRGRFGGAWDLRYAVAQAGGHVLACDVVSEEEFRRGSVHAEPVRVLAQARSSGPELIGEVLDEVEQSERTERWRKP